MESAHHALTPEAFEALANETGALLLETRSGAAFAKGFVPGSINSAFDGSFAVWAGTLIEDMQQPILIIAEPGREDEVITRLARVGYDQVKGFLAGGFASWVIAGKDRDTVQTITAHAFHQRLLANPHLRVIDVRKQSEFESQHLEGAVNVPLDYINEQQHQLPPELSYYIHCAGGYRSMTFISILQARGYRHLINIDGGFGAIRTLPHIALTSFQQPVTML